MIAVLLISSIKAAFASVAIRANSDVNTSPSTFSFNGALTSMEMSCSQFYLTGSLKSVSLSRNLESPTTQRASDMAFGVWNVNQEGGLVVHGETHGFDDVRTTSLWPSDWISTVAGSYSANVVLSDEDYAWSGSRFYKFCVQNTGSATSNFLGTITVNNQIAVVPGEPTKQPVTMTPTIRPTRTPTSRTNRPTLIPRSRPTSTPTSKPTVQMFTTSNAGVNPARVSFNGALSAAESSCNAFEMIGAVNSIQITSSVPLARDIKASEMSLSVFRVGDTEGFAVSGGFDDFHHFENIVTDRYWPSDWSTYKAGTFTATFDTSEMNWPSGTNTFEFCLLNSNGEGALMTAFSGFIQVDGAVQSSKVPTSSPTFKPSSSPRSKSFSPTATPVAVPTNKPSKTPSSKPSKIPSREPSSTPTSTPTSDPSRSPSVTPTTSPSSVPTSSPSWQPSVQPTIAPVPQVTTAMIFTYDITESSNIIRHEFHWDGFLAPGDRVCQEFTFRAGWWQRSDFQWFMTRYLVEGYESHSFGYMTMLIQNADRNSGWLVMDHRSSSNYWNTGTSIYKYPVSFDGTPHGVVYNPTPPGSNYWFFPERYRVCIENKAIPGYYDNPIYYRTKGISYIGIPRL